MISLLLGHLGSAAGGAILKGILGMLSNAQENKHERYLARKEQLAAANNRWTNADNYTKHTRRMLALLVVGTYCGIMVLWAIYPSAEIVTLFEPSEQTKGYGLRFFGFDFLGIETPANLAKRLFTVTTGHLVLSNSYLLSFILGAYFMPVGKK